MVNQKGGVGKTTTAVNLAAGLALAHSTTLIVDLDPQGNATSGLGIQKTDLYPTIYHVLLGSEPLSKALLPTDFSHLKLLPSDIDLVGAEIELVGIEQRESRLKAALGRCRAYGWTIIDCPPSLVFLRSTHWSPPIGCSFRSSASSTRSRGSRICSRPIKLVRERLNPGLEVGGIVLTMFDGRTSLALQIRDEVNRYFPGQIFETVIPRNVRLTEAPSHGKPVMLHDLRSSGCDRLSRTDSGGSQA